MSSLNIVLKFVFDLACLVFLLRFLLQASGADFYNQISQAIVKATDSVCKPIRMLIKPYANFDFASLIVAWLISVIGIVVFQAIYLGKFLFLPLFLWFGVIKTLLVLTQFYKFAIIIMVIASFLAPSGYNPVLALLNALLEPIIGPVRRVIPNLGPLDLSPMVVILIIILVEDILSRSLI